MNVTTNGRKVVYVGPTIKNGLVSNCAVFTDGHFPAAVEELRKKSPSLRGLFVPIDELAAARRRVRRKGDILNSFARKLAAELK